MIVYYNNKPITLNLKNTIKDVLEAGNAESTKGIAIAVNNTVIPKASWESYELKDQDKLTVIKATQGG